MELRILVFDLLWWMFVCERTLPIDCNGPKEGNFFGWLLPPTTADARDTRTTTHHNIYTLNHISIFHMHNLTSQLPRAMYARALDFVESFLICCFCSKPVIYGVLTWQAPVPGQMTIFGRRPNVIFVIDWQWLLRRAILHFIWLAIYFFSDRR